MFIADLHIHSRFSRATSRSLTLPLLDHWAGRKGINLLGTGDMTHPQWLQEIEEQLTPAEEGLYRLKPEFRPEGGGETRFTLSGEISSIYKRDGRVRKVHSLILMPDIEAARNLARRLERLGNIRSDGRPILGVDARDLLALCLEVSPNSFFIPAHIWTPWFSLLGSKSGFDAVEECFGDLTPEIKALETGLSSDPPMNWRLSALDRYVLVSNSDAHGPEKLGREANLFTTEMSYPAMVKAMSGQGGFSGTIEFFPEEGKYHLDGHRKCQVRLEPEETVAQGGVCPVCGEPVTVGVMNRVLELADRPAGYRLGAAPAYHSLIPLTEVLGEVHQTGPQSKAVAAAYEALLQNLGSELHILREASLDDVGRVGGGLLALALKRMRAGKVLAQAGYDGEFGRIGLFAPGERAELAGQANMFGPTAARAGRRSGDRSQITRPPLAEPRPVRSRRPAELALLSQSDPLLDDLNPAQAQAVAHEAGPLVIVAGPGTGKTLVLTRRLAWLVREGRAKPEEILGVTFTRRAAAEMSSRLAGCLPYRPELRKVSLLTFHALGLKILTEWTGRPPKILTEEERLLVAKQAAERTGVKAPAVIDGISRAKQLGLGPGDLDDPRLTLAFGRYEVALAAMGAVDFDDLVARPAAILTEHPELVASWRRRYPWLLVDEYQDVNHVQYQLTRLLTDPDQPRLTVIGDPDQAIYGFRGADAAYFTRFKTDYPQATQITLTRNYRSSETILKASGQVIAHNPAPNRGTLTSGLKGAAKVTTAALATPAAEAEYVIRQIEKLLGGSSHLALNSGRAAGNPGDSLGLADIAVLYRLHVLARPLADALDQAGLPYQQAGTEPVRETDQMDPAADKINLLSMHAAKGLEFEVVFVVGLESGILPYCPPEKSPAEVNEERRLFFVALTRARRHLFLTRSRTRTLYGRRGKPGPSPFLEEIGRGLKLVDQLPSRGPKLPKSRQLGLF